MPSKNKNKTQKKVNRLVKKVGWPLYKISTIFPFDFFQTKIEINEKTVNLVFQTFFFSKNTFPLLLSDIKNVRASTDLFFGSLRFEVSGYEKNPPAINFLPKNKAIKARQIIIGLIILQKEDIDLTKISADKLIKKSPKTRQSPSHPRSLTHPQLKPTIYHQLTVFSLDFSPL